MKFLHAFLVGVLLSAIVHGQTTVNNTAAALSGKTVILAESAATVTGLYSFTRSPSAPFAVQAASANVANLDADLLDGQHGAFYQTATNVNAGNLPYAQLPTGGGTWALGGSTTLSANLADFPLKVTQTGGTNSSFGGLFVSTVSTAVKTLDVNNNGTDIFVVMGSGTVKISALAPGVGHTFFLCIDSTGAVTSQSAACPG